MGVAHKKIFLCCCQAYHALSSPGRKKEEWGLIELSLEKKGLEIEINYTLTEEENENDHETRTGFLKLQDVNAKLKR